MTVFWGNFLRNVLAWSLTVFGIFQDDDNERLDNMSPRDLCVAWHETIQSYGLGEVQALSPGQLYELASRVKVLGNP